MPSYVQIMSPLVQEHFKLDFRLIIKKQVEIQVYHRDITGTDQNADDSGNDR